MSKLPKFIFLLCAMVVVASCGGGAGGGNNVATSPLGCPPVTFPMVDSLGRTLPESSFAGGDSGATGVDGTAGDGAPISNAPVELRDSTGRSVSAVTDENGYYRVSVKGLIPPFIVKVTRNDGTEWYAPSIAPVKCREFITINLTGLTDKVTNYIADAASLSGGASSVSTTVLSNNPELLTSSIKKVNESLQIPLSLAGIDTLTFDPVKVSYKATKSDKYDLLLDSLRMAKKANGNTQIVGTYAGVRDTYTDGSSGVVTIGAITGILDDGAGNIIVADTENHAIRKITPLGIVTTIAGTGTPGFNDGIGTTASFSRPNQMVMDGIGNIYIVDTGNHAVRKMTLAGVVTTIAGSGRSGFINASGKAAKFANPFGIARDTSGNLYVSDQGNHVIRKIDSSGNVTTVAGNGISGYQNGIDGTAQFSYPAGIAIDEVNNIYVADSHNNVIRKIDSGRNVSTLAGDLISGSIDGIGLSSRFFSPTAIVYDSSGSFYIGDAGNNMVRKLVLPATVTTVAGAIKSGFKDGTGKSANLGGPAGIAMSLDGSILVADTKNAAVRKISTAGVVTTIVGQKSEGFVNGPGVLARFNNPFGVASDSSGNVYVADTHNQVIRKISASGIVSTFAGTGTVGLLDGISTVAQFAGPTDLVADKFGNVFVTDFGNDLIRKISPSGNVTSFASISSPWGIAIDNSGTLYVTQPYGSSISKISTSGVVTLLAGGVDGFEDGTAFAKFFFPLGIAVDGKGNLVIADTGNNAIRKLSPSGVITTIAGNGTTGFANGIGISATFNLPNKIAVTPSGTIYVTDSENDAIREISPSGQVTTLSGGLAGYANGVGSEARFSNPQGITLDRNGNIIISDTYNNAIRIILP